MVDNFCTWHNHLLFNVEKTKELVDDRIDDRRRT